MSKIFFIKNKKIYVIIKTTKNLNNYKNNKKIYIIVKTTKKSILL